MDNTQSDNHRIHNTQYTIQYIIQCTQYNTIHHNVQDDTVHNSQYTIHNTECTIHNVQYTVHDILEYTIQYTTQSMQHTHNTTTYTE